MRIGINLLYLLPNIVGGTETYARGILRGFSRAAAGRDIVVFLNEESALCPFITDLEFERIVCRVRASRRIDRYLFEQFKFPCLLRKHRISLVHSLGYVGPLRPPCPSVVTIPDLNSIDIGQTLPLVKRAALRFFTRQSAKKSDRIITISRYSKKALCDRWRIDPAKVTVTYLGAPEEGDRSSPEEWKTIRCRYGIREPYIAAFGGGAAHKNIGLLMEAFKSLSTDIPHSVVIIGHCPPGFETLMPDDVPRDRITLTGYIPGDHIMPILGHGDLFVFPSLYEGFGLPVLEAQKAGIPVVCSSAASLPEIAGEGALFFDPRSVGSLVDAIRACLDDPDRRESLLRLATENLNRFSWDKTAEETLAVYRGILDSSGPADEAPA